MCGRFTSTTPVDDIATWFDVDEVRVDDREPNRNVCPTDAVLAVAEHGERRLLGAFRWGLVPSWAPDPKRAAKMINARAETLLERPAYRDAIGRRRCLLPADGFYEWRLDDDGVKRPWLIAHAAGELIAFAGLWDVWRGQDPPLRTCTIVTTAANAAVRPLHDRMPVVVARADWDLWLDREAGAADVLPLLGPAPDDLLTVAPVDPGTVRS